MRDAAGMTLIEVVIAIAVLVIGVLSAAQLQAVALRNTGLAQAINEVTRAARSELELQRHTATIMSDLAAGEAAVPVDAAVFDCTTRRTAGISTCEVTVEPCTIAQLGSATLVCGAGVRSPPAYRITVEVAGRRGVAIAVSTVATGIYIAGAAGGD
jgi:prepilin-type N-terminal cleavage/methylation domain-containing protein